MSKDALLLGALAVCALEISHAFHHQMQTAQGSCLGYADSKTSFKLSPISTIRVGK
jgi:hypothetical protein